MLVGFPGLQGVQLALDLHQLAVAGIVLVEQLLVMGILVQQPQMGGRVCQALAVMLAVNTQEPCGNVPYHSRRGGHAVDAAGTFAVGADFPVQKQIIGVFVAEFFQLFVDRSRNLLKGGPDGGLLGTAANQFPGCTVAKNGVDGVDEDGFARTRFAGQHVQAGCELHLGLFDDRDIFNFQLCQHVDTPLLLKCGARCIAEAVGRCRRRLPPSASR